MIRRLHKRLLALPVGAALALLGLQHYTAVFAFPQDVHPGQQLFASRFDTGLTGLKFSGDGTRTFDAAMAGDGPGGVSCRLGIRWDAAAPAYRAELVPIDVAGFYHGCYPRIGEEYEYSFRLFLPADWQVDADTESVAQWHGAPDRLLFEGDLNPAMALNLVGTNYELDIRNDSRFVTSLADGYEGSATFALGDLRTDLGRWVEWRFRVQWSWRTQDPGRVQVFHDGRKVLDRVGPNCFHDLRGGPYWKVGLYKWSWITRKSAMPAVRERVLWIDSLRIDAPAD